MVRTALRSVLLFAGRVCITLLVALVLVVAAATRLAVGAWEFLRDECWDTLREVWS